MKTKSSLQAQGETPVDSTCRKSQTRENVLGGKLAAVTLPFLALVLAASPARAGGNFSAAWPAGAPGIWEQDGVWSTNAYPNNGHFVLINGNPVPGPNPTYDVLIDVLPPCTLGRGVNVQTVNIFLPAILNLAPLAALTAHTGFGNGGQINLANASLLYAYTSPINGIGLGNAGVITLNATNSATSLIVGNGSFVNNGGQILMSASINNAIYAINHGDSFSIQPAGSIRGAGQLNVGFLGNTAHLLNIENRGLIEATQPAAPLNIGLAQDVNAHLTNTGTIRAAGGTLLIRHFSTGGSVFNNGGTITALDGSTVRIGGGVTVSGGTLTTSGSGAIRGGEPPGGGGGTLADLTNTGTVAIADQETLTLAGLFTNNGSVTLASVGGGAVLRFVDGTTLTGTGVVSLSNNGSNYLTSVNGSEAMTIASGATIQGAGTISPGFSGGSNMLRITNRGLVHANISGAALTIRAEASNNTPFTNDGTLRASNGATLTFSGSSTLTNNGGTLEVLAGSTISAGGGIILLQTAGTIDLNGGDMNFPLGVDLNGGQLIGNGTFTGPIRNNGGIVGPGHSPGKITVSGNYTQGSTGALNLEIGGHTPVTQYDQLAVTGNAALSGTLNISLINGFVPAVGDVFQIISTGSFSGAFSTLNTTGFTAQLNYNASSITMTVLTVGGVTPTPSPTPTAPPTATPSKLLNIATRMRVQTGENVIIGGFIITGTDSKNVIIRGIGPSLSSFFSGVLANPTLELFQGGTLLQSNNDWKDTQRTDIEGTGLQPGNDFESAILRTLPPGSYTAVLRGSGDTTGIAVVEAYDLNQAANSKLANIATRGFVEAGDNVMIGGLIIGPAGGSTARVVVRAIGPSLTAFGVTGALQDPSVELKDVNGSTLIGNDDWMLGQPGEIQPLGLAPTDTRESALVTTLAPGAYTAIVRGVGNTAGVGLVEVYHVQ